MNRQAAWRAGVLAVGVLAALAGGCAQHKPVDPEPPIPTTPPALGEVVRAYNARIAGLPRLWSRLELKFTGTDADGRPIDEESEGFFITEPPAKLSMSVNKLGEAYFLLGSNPEQYWWFDLSRPERPAYVGSHAQARPEKAAQVGLPVHPLDLLELVACTPLNEKDPAMKAVWAKGGLVEVSSPVRWGVRMIYVNPADGKAKRVVLADNEGRTLVESTLDKYEPVERSKATVATLITLNLAKSSRGTLTVRMTLYGMEDRNLNPALFDLAEQKQRREVRRVIDLDAQPQAEKPR